MPRMSSTPSVTISCTRMPSIAAPGQLRRALDLRGRPRAEMHATDVRFVRNIRRLNLERHRPADGGRDAHRLGGALGKLLARDRQAGGSENFLTPGLG